MLAWRVSAWQAEKIFSQWQEGISIVTPEEKDLCDEKDINLQDLSKKYIFLLCREGEEYCLTGEYIELVTGWARCSIQKTIGYSEQRSLNWIDRLNIIRSR